MAIKLRSGEAETPPPLKMVPDNGAATEAPAVARNSIPPPPPINRAFATNPEMDARLDSFMKADSKSTEYFTKLVAENPERAVRKLMLNEMQKHDNDMKYVAKMKPQVEKWIGEQSPEVVKRIHDRIQNVPPIYQEKALIRAATQVKARMEFAPAPRQAMSVG